MSIVKFFYAGATGLTGVTVNSVGTPLGSVIVKAFITSSNAFAGQVTSDPTTGVYSIILPKGNTYFLVGYKAGSPDLAGTTVNTITV